MSTPFAKMQLFTRTAHNLPWQQFSEPESVILGEAGLGWGYTFDHFKRDGEFEKAEGDKRTPAGIFRIGPSFGFERSSAPGHIVVEAGRTVCVEDSSSTFYNTITTRTDIGPNVKVDDMRRTPLYRRGLFIDYPTDRTNRRGSCVFIHILDVTRKGTAGCITMPGVRVALLQEFSSVGAVLAVVPEFALDRFDHCLPSDVQDCRSALARSHLTPRGRRTGLVS